MKTTPRLILNDDGDAAILLMKPPYKPEQIFPLIDSLEGTDVDVYLYGVNRGGDTYRHKTNIGGTIEDHSDWQRGGWGASVKEVIEQGIAIRRAGIDPLSVLVQRAMKRVCRSGPPFA
jgi:hypothetical protein